MSPRYALYLAPPADSPWGEFGAQWLGRCAIRGRGGPARTTAAAIAGLDEALRAQLVAQPARYGFHATLKAPFRLRSDAVAGALIAQLDQFCSEQSGFPLPRLQPARLGNFIALVPGAADPRVDALATACVTRFDALRAPLSKPEFARRLQAGLSAREQEYLERWGYPHVMECFRLHFSLTGPLTGPLSGPLTGPLAGHDAALAGALLRAAAERMPAEPFACDSICVFREARPGADFECIHRANFSRSGRLVYVVGPSGAGKDSLLAWVREHLPAEAPVEFARRTITRPAQARGERHLPVSAESFVALQRQGEFAMHWTAHGQHYGIGQEIRAWLARGLTVVVSGSREHLPRAVEAFPELEVVHICASRETLRNRLQARGRETGGAIEARLVRPEFAVPDGVPWVDIANEHDLESAGRALRALLTGPAARARQPANAGDVLERGR